MINTCSITQFNSKSRSDNHIICYEDKWSNNKYKTWKDFLIDTYKLRTFINRNNNKDWILHCEDYYLFLCSFTALLQCKKHVLLTQNISESYINEIKREDTLFLTDQNIKDSINITLIINNEENPTENQYRDTPVIIRDNTEISMYTSGSTGKPKAVSQRMTEFEKDNDFIISKWGQEFTSRKLITSVSQHHIYGFLFGISLPFTLGVPFRRKRIEFPEEFESLDDESYILISTPAFLKRSVEILDHTPLKEPFIFTSGGALLPETATKTKQVFGFCPLEVYGSTETSGIAYRQQTIHGLRYNPFDNAKIWLGEDGCIRVISPYIKNKEGFATQDLAEIYEDGTFILKGRKDSIVKIEEKRISLTEVENRLLDTKLIKEVKVVALSNEIRQYLACAIVLNEEGQKLFIDKDKFIINKYFHDYLLKYFENVVTPKKWRYLPSLPKDIQGKIKKIEIEELFK